MFDADTLLEIWATLTRHKLRTFLSALSVAWGVLVLIVLLGAGNGLENGATDTFQGDAANSVWISNGATSLPFAGQGPGRKIKLDNADYDVLLGLRPKVEYTSAGLNLSGTFTVRYGNRRSTFVVRGAMPEVRYIENTRLREGRLLNEDDQLQHRKVAVIGPQVQDILFGKNRSIGEYIQVRGSIFRVIGVYEDPFGIDDDQRNIFVPLSTVQLLNGSSTALEDLGMTVADYDEEEGKKLVTTIRETIADRHHVAKDDRRAVRFWNNLEQYAKVRRMFVWIRVFVWLVGIGTLLAGVVGVSNIMLISIKERTQEIGIRKAIGATPASIVRMIVAESLLITGIAGYVGLAGGIGAIRLAARFLPSMKYLRDPSVNFGVALGATAIIVLAGTLAGFFPARQAASIHPITALRTE
jgi:putative ABC transport system permease protein